MEAEEKLGPDMDWGVKLVEQSGFPLGRCFVPKFPILAGCPRGVDCIICNNTAVKCSKKGAIYKATCMWCKKGLNMDPTHGGGSVSAGMDGMNNAPIGGEELSNGPVGMDGMNKAPERGGIGGPLCSGEMNKLISYMGETSRPLRDRVWEHMQNLRNGNPKSFIVSHWMESHEHTLEAPEFQWTVVDAYNDALRRQLAEGLHIMESGLLNKKFEFSNNLICRMEVSTNDSLNDENLRLEMARRKTYCDNINEFIRKKAMTTDVIVLKKNKKIILPLTPLIPDQK